jgi:hypothetical protein
LSESVFYPTELPNFTKNALRDPVYAVMTAKRTKSSGIGNKTGFGTQNSYPAGLAIGENSKEKITNSAPQTF